MADGKGSPVGGIYWLRFALHRDTGDPKQLWFEEIYVAVDRGSYRVELGKHRPIPLAVDLTSLFLSVQVDGQEVQRVPVQLSMLSTAAEPAGPSGAAPGACPECAHAATADNCQKLEGLSFKQIVDTAVKRQITVGATAHFTSAVGNGEGTPFRLTCPPGFVMTGLKGKATDTIGNLQLVCSPLEAQ